MILVYCAKTCNLSAVSRVCFCNVMPKRCLWLWNLFAQWKTNEKTKEAKSISYFGLFYIKNEFRQNLNGYDPVWPFRLNPPLPFLTCWANISKSYPLCGGSECLVEVLKRNRDREMKFVVLLSPNKMHIVK